MIKYQIKCLLLPEILGYMLRLLLYTSTESTFLVPVLWGIGIFVLIILGVAVFMQHRTGKKLQDELLELEKVRQGNVEYEFVLKAMNLSTWHIDAKLRLITADSDFRQGIGNVTPSPNSSLDLLIDQISDVDVERVRAALDDICSGRSNYYHQQYRVKSGIGSKYFWEEGFATIASRDDNGRPLKIVGTSRRIDEQKDMEVALINARNKAEESDRLKTAFLANMGHEIRTPLNAIVGFADLLPVVESEEDRNQLIEEIRNNNHKLLRIIDGLVSMSKVESEAKSLVKSQVDVVPVLKQIAATFSQAVDNKEVTLLTDFPYPEMMTNTDVTKLEETINNLMDNAIKFTQKGTITLGFDLSGGDYLHIWVRDTGKGIAISDQERIFERFVKLDEYIPGTGLGLSVAKSHAVSLGGTITVESVPGQGSTFTLNLPLL